MAAVNKFEFNNIFVHTVKEALAKVNAELSEDKQISYTSYGARSVFKNSRLQFEIMDDNLALELGAVDIYNIDFNNLRDYVERKCRKVFFP